jgi:hypothetical protein
MKVMVLNDGETYTDLAGCHIVEIPEDCDAEDLEELLSGFMASDEDEANGFRIVCGFMANGEKIPY